jgi:integrase/recombinase XerD
MDTSAIRWSEEKRRNLQEQLTGSWAEDTWRFTSRDGKHRRSLHFDVRSPFLKIELKYAFWHKFESGEWSMTGHIARQLHEAKQVISWVDQVAANGISLLERSLEQWELAYRSYLVEIGHYKPRTTKRLSAAQQMVFHETEDARIALLRGIYAIVMDGYDDRLEKEKDIWDMLKLGLDIDLTSGYRSFDFTPITQSWLRTLAKAFLEYRIAIRSAADRYSKLMCIREFSCFLANTCPRAQLADLDRGMMLAYMSFLQERKYSDIWRRNLLIGLRTFLETCAHRLSLSGVSRERLIFDDDLPKESKELPREIPEEVLVQLRKHLDALPTTTLRMVVILLECGMRLNELCNLPWDCLICDDKHEWYLRFYQRKLKQEHIIPLVNEAVVGAIQAQQQDMRAQWGNACIYLFPRPKSPQLPFKQCTFRDKLNKWAYHQQIRDQTGQLYHFQSHQFRHPVGMRLINDDEPLDVIRRLLGHASVRMTERYARKRAKQVRAELERVYRKRKTVDYQGNALKGDPRANDLEVQMTRKGVRGQTLPVGGCGRLVVLGDCTYANKCLTCPMWLTSTDDLPKLKSFYERAVRLKQRAQTADNHFVVEQQERIIAGLAVRINSLENLEMNGTLCVDDVLAQLRQDLAEAESALEEARENGLVSAAKYLERTIADLKARIAALEETL